MFATMASNKGFDMGLKALPFIGAGIGAYMGYKNSPNHPVTGAIGGGFAGGLLGSVPRRAMSYGITRSAAIKANNQFFGFGANASLISTGMGLAGGLGFGYFSW